MTVRRLSAIATLTLVASAAALAGCGGSGPEPATKGAGAAVSTPAPTAHEWTHGYPDSIAVLGHSGSTGENSDPKQPGLEVRENSWATGTSPQVNSLYLRILKHNPAITDHNLGLSEGGADIQRVAAQADRLLDEEGGADLVVIQVMDNDMTCPVEPDALATFRGQLTAMVKKLARRMPSSREFVVSQFGSVPTGVKALTRDELASQGGTGPCDPATPSGAIKPKKIARLEKAIHAYEGALATACKKVRQCTYDGGAFGRIIDRREYVSDDLNHFSLTGHAKAAAVAWAALRRANVLPK
jgi:hypothetical protein